MHKSKKQSKTSRTMKNRTKHMHKSNRKTGRRKTAHRKTGRKMSGGMMSFMSMFDTPKPQQAPSVKYSDISDWDREYNAPAPSVIQRPSVGIATVTYNTQDDIKNICRQLGIDETKVNAALIADAINNKSAFINGQSINGWSNLGRQIMVKDAIKYLSDEDKIRFLPMLGSKYDKLTMPAHQLVMDARKNIEAKYAKRW